MIKLQLIKTLPHLWPLHLKQQEIAVYATSFSRPILTFLSAMKLYDELTFSQIRQILTPTFNRTSHIAGYNDYSIVGDIVSFWPLGYDSPIRAEFFGEKIEKLYSYDLYTGRKLKTLESVWLSTEQLEDKTDRDAIKINPESESHNIAIFSTFVPENAPAGLPIKDFDYVYPPLLWSRLDLLTAEVNRFKDQKYKVLVYTKHFNSLPESVQQLITHQHTEDLQETYDKLPAGFISNDEKMAVFTDREIFGTIYLSSNQGSDNTSKLLRQFEGEISIGDYVVHEDYGVGIYDGLKQQEVEGVAQDYLLLKYAEGDELYVPISQIQKLTRYIGQEGLKPRLTRLGKAEWNSVKQKVKKSAGLLARELVEHYARRELAQTKPIPEKDSKEYEAFVGKFEYEETPDQQRAINEVIFDLQQNKPMNRLLIGDVGFGKTEVMMRAVFKVVEQGGQVAILCPTTVLAAQHFAVFTKRFADTDFKVISLSRFNTSHENAELVDLLNSGKANIVIGTHRLLSGDVKFKNLQMLVVDEEQRFGVKQKEKIRKINYEVHYLSVSATPIPRTLSMALSSIQDISIIATAPKGRKSIETKLLKNDWNALVDGIKLELDRGGQIYFVHNQVQSILSVKSKLESLIPGVKITIGHGQMPPSKLDQAMTDFYSGKYQILLCTTIIENGLDMPNVNTIIIDQAHRLGLAQLYQLRGRVGRSGRQAYCYLFYEGKKLESATDLSPEDKETKQYLQRLEAIIEASALGSGFQIASRDLEIRGAGNILGDQQHGNISTLGYVLYMQILAQEIDKLKQIADTKSPDVSGIVSF